MVVAAKPSSAAAEIAREANAHILAQEARLHPLPRDEGLVGLFCECGCLEIVAATRSDYEAAGGAWCDGHRTAHDSS